MLWNKTSHTPNPKHPLTRHPGIAKVIALSLIVACLGVGLHYEGTQAATSTTANLDGYKINTSKSRTGSFSAAKVSIRKVTTGAVNSSTGQPFYLNALPAIAGGDHYVVSISPTSVPGYTVKGLTWCLNACTGFNELTTNFRAGSSTEFTFYPGNNYHMRWIFQPVAAPTPVPAPVKTPTPVPTTPTPTSSPMSSTTPEAVASPDSSAPHETTLTSSDGIVDVTLNSDAIGDDAECSVSESADAVSVAKDQTKIAGPYELSCKTALGANINAFAKPVMWTYHLKDRLGNNLVPKAFAVKPNGGKQEISGAFYDKGSQDLNFATADTGETMVLASSEPPSLMVYGLIGLAVLLVGLAVGALFFIRRPVKQSYEEYIRSKYYDL